MVNKKNKSTTKSLSKKTKISNFPKVVIDLDNNFASIRLNEGIESKSYEKDGFVFSEDSKGKILEIQILNYKV